MVDPLAVSQELRAVGFTDRQAATLVEILLETRVQGARPDRLRAPFDRLAAKLDGLEQRLAAKLDALERHLAAKFDGLESKMLVALEQQTHALTLRLIAIGAAAVLLTTAIAKLV